MAIESGEQLNFGYGETMSDIQVAVATHIPFGNGKVGLRNRLQTPEEEAQFANSLQPFVRPVTILNTADCVEDRPIEALADGTHDPATLADRVAYQRPGGLAVDFTKAAVGVWAAYLRDAKTFKEAYERTIEVLIALGLEDSAHNNCGADLSVEASVANEVPEDELLEVAPALTFADERNEYYLHRNRENKRQLLQAGFYGGWDPAWHFDFVASRFPRNAAIIKVDPSDHETHGHQARGALIVGKPGYGLAKTAFYQQTGDMAFGITPVTTDPLTPQIIEAIGGSDEEKARLRLELGVDPSQVFNGLIAKGMPAFAAAA